MPKPYPRGFRDDVVRVARSRDDGVTLEQVAADFGIHPMTLSKSGEDVQRDLDVVRRRRQYARLPVVRQRRRGRPQLRTCPDLVQGPRRVVEARATDPQHPGDHRHRCQSLGHPPAAERRAVAYVSRLDAFPNSSFSNAS
jgi:transposase